MPRTYKGRHSIARGVSPWIRQGEMEFSPGGAKVRSVAPPGLEQLPLLSYQRLTPLVLSNAAPPGLRVPTSPTTPRSHGLHPVGFLFIINHRNTVPVLHRLPEGRGMAVQV